jgi:serine/threonine-protein kinase
MRLEGQALARLSHPNIVAVLGFEQTADGRPFLLMESLSGRTLGLELEERGALPVRTALDYSIELLSALSAAHEIGVVHRNVKPDNILLVDGPDGGRKLKLLDFGIARVLPGAPVDAPVPLAVPTSTGAVIGTPRFLSPEAARGQHVDTRADVYGAGLVLYLMLCGRGPFDDVRGEQAVLSAHAEAIPAPPSRYAREPISAELDPIVLRALDKDPDARYPSASAFRAELEAVLASLDGLRPTGPPAPGPVPSFSALPRRTIVTVALVGLFAAVLSGAAVVLVARLLRGAG